MTFEIENSGDILLQPTFTHSTLEGDIQVTPPKSIQVPPGEKRRCTLAILCENPGDFVVEGTFDQVQETKKIRISGTGTMIKLSQSGMKLLHEATLDSLQLLEPLQIVEQTKSLELHMRTLKALHLEDVDMSKTLTSKLRQIPFESRQVMRIQPDNEVRRIEIVASVLECPVEETIDVLEQVSIFSL